MRRFVLFINVFAFVLGAFEAFAAEKPRLGVLRFSNDTHASWWGQTSGTELQDMLIAELASTKHLAAKVIAKLKRERDQLRAELKQYRAAA